MGIRGELFSTRVSCEGRTYFFNVKQNRMGDVFLSIVESKPTEPDTFDRRSIVVFGSDVKPFIKAFQTALSFMEKPREASRPLSFAPADPMPVRKMKKRQQPIAVGEEAEKRTDSRPPIEGRSPSGLDTVSRDPATTALKAPEKKRLIVVRRAKPDKTPPDPAEAPAPDPDSFNT